MKPLNTKKHSPVNRSLSVLVLGLCLWLLIPAQALANTLIRFIHAVPGVGKATVQINDGSGNVDIGSIGFGQVTPWHSVRSGSFQWVLQGAGGKTLVAGASTVGKGAYDIVVLDKSSGVTMGIYKARAGKPGTSLVRVIHAAPELGSPELTVDSKEAVKSLAFTQATPYVSLPPGVHTLGAMKPGGTASPVAGGRVTLASGVAYSAIVVGSRGQRVRVVAVVDRGAPLTRSGSGGSAGSSGSSSSASSSGSVVVKPGDSLWSIARSLLPAGASNVAIEHKVVAIWDANANRIGTGDPNLIFSGTRLRLA
jgi:LysM repeat protein